MAKKTLLLSLDGGLIRGGMELQTIAIIDELIQEKLSCDHYLNELFKKAFCHKVSEQSQKKEATIDKILSEINNIFPFNKTYLSTVAQQLKIQQDTITSIADDINSVMSNSAYKKNINRLCAICRWNINWCY